MIWLAAILLLIAGGYLKGRRDGVAFAARAQRRGVDQAHVLELRRQIDRGVIRSYGYHEGSSTVIPTQKEPPE